MAKDWYLTSSSNYFSGYENDDFSLNAVDSFDELLNHSPEAYTVLVNNTDAKRVIVQYEEENERRLITHINEIKLGDIITHKNHNWLVVAYVDDNKMHSFTTMKLCNALFPITSDKIPDLLRDEYGNLIRDDYGRPIPIETGGETKLEPCVVETKFAISQQTEQIRLPEDKILVSMRYQESKSLQINSEFEMYNSRFRIIFTDFSKVINGVGVMTLTGERLVN